VFHTSVASEGRENEEYSATLTAFSDAVDFPRNMVAAVDGSERYRKFFKATSTCMCWRGGADRGLADLSGGNVTKGGGMRFAFPYAC
jgi:hypothetical protein